MKSFDFYEFTGVLIPGVIVLYVSSLIIPEISFITLDKSISIGSLGLFVILSYVAGHLIQAFGNLFENIFWRFRGGLPSDWPRSKISFLLADLQIGNLENQVQELLAISPTRTIANFNKQEWFAITRQIYAAVQSAGKSQRVDTFNGNYGMFRGAASAFLFCSVLSLSMLPGGWKVLVFLSGCTLLAFYRMHRFGVHYARELFVQFLQLEFTKRKEEK
jgi:hypothetical protein